MSTIFKSTFGQVASKVATIAAIAGLAVTVIGATSAEARPWNDGWHDHGGHRWEHPTRWDHARWYGGRTYYGPHYYAAPPVVYPPAYYGPPSLNFNIPLG